MGAVPVVYVRAQNIRSKKITTVPISLGARFSGEAGQYPSALQPIGFERAITIKQPDGSLATFKGAGERDQENRYFDRMGRSTGKTKSGILSPFSANEDPNALQTHILLGGGEQAILEYEFAQAAELVNMVRKLGIEIGGLPEPKAVYRLLEIPVIAQNGEVALIRPEDYFMNTRFTTRKQRSVIIKYLRKHESKATGIAAAKAFVRLFQPAVYEYKGLTAPRIGNTAEIIDNGSGMLQSLLIERGQLAESKTLDAKGNKIKITREADGAFGEASLIDYEAGMADVPNSEIKDIVDELIQELYSSAGIKIKLLKTTELDLHSLGNRLAYLREIRKLNQKAAEKLTKYFADEMAKQLGIIHGSGGHVGGGQDLSGGGRLIMIFKDKENNKYELLVEFSDNAGKEGPLLKWKGKTPKTAKPFSFDGLTLIKMRDGQSESFKEIGCSGGGSTRCDNVGAFGMRDFDTLCLQAEDQGIDSLLKLLPAELTASKKTRAYLKYFFLRLKQEIDLDLLYCPKTRFDPKPFPGTFMYFVLLSGGKMEDYFKLKVHFQKKYAGWYEKARLRLAPGWFGRIRGEQRNADLSLDFSFQRLRTELHNNFVNEFFGAEAWPAQNDCCRDHVENNLY